MDRFQAMQVFVRVVETNSFSKAAEALDLQRTSATNIIQNLESQLGVRLLQRTTRRVSLTPEGAEYYERCVRMLAELEDMDASVRGGQGTPRGKLRVDMPASLARALILPALPEFRAKFPQIELSIGTSDRTVDLVQDGIDCVIRAGALETTNLVSRRVGAYHLVTCATPKYLARYGEPKTLDDLESHVAVNYFFPRNNRIRPFNFVVDGNPVDFKLKSAVLISDADSHLLCGLEGIGLFQSANFMVLPYVRSGQLVEVLTTWPSSPVPFYVLYPHRVHLSPRVRVFVDWAAELFEHCSMLTGK